MQYARIPRRRFLKTAIRAGALVAVPQVIPGAALGKDGAVLPADKIIVGGIGIGGQGSSDLGCFLQEPDVQVVATCDVRAERRAAIKAVVDRKYGNENCIAYANGVKLVMRDGGWLGLGSCPVRFEGEAGWVETGDSGKINVGPLSLNASFRGTRGRSAGAAHIRDFLDCVKSRGQPRASAEVTCQTHIACHAANIALFLRRKLAYDPRKNEFVDDAEANRLRGEALREPWRV
ncbi:MAG: hypothetical protein ABR915_09685 [Thermoguttaceae bacterium]|jgi:hypothetical protein